MGIYPVWVSPEKIEEATNRLNRLLKKYNDVTDDGVQLYKCREMLDILRAEKPIPLFIKSLQNYPGWLQWSPGSFGYSGIPFETGLYFIRLIDTTSIQLGYKEWSIPEAWDAGDEIVFDRGNKDVAEQLGTSHLPLKLQDALSNFPEIKYLFGYTPKSMEISYLIGVSIEKVNLPEGIKTQELEQIKSLLNIYQQNVIRIVNRGSAQVIKDTYASCKSERNASYNRISDLGGWHFVGEKTLVYDIKFKEWDLERNRWNVGRVLATFLREL